MAVIACATCRKLLDVDPVKCPYCGVIQSNRAVDAKSRRIRLAALAIGGLGMGLSVGRSLGRPALKGVQVPALKVSAAPSGFEETTRNRAKHLAPYRLVELEDIYLTPEKVMGQRVAVPGLIGLNETTIDWRGARVQLCRLWGLSTWVIVDIGSLSPEYQKTLVRVQDGRYVFLIKGEVRPGGISSWGEKVHIVAQEIEPLGETDGLDGVAQADRILAREAGSR